MCNRFRSIVGKEWKPGDALPLELTEGVVAEGIWAGCAQQEKRKWWLRQTGNQIAQGPAVAEIAERADDTGEVIWGPAPEGAHLLFILEPVQPGKTYLLAKMLTTAANEDQLVYYRHGRFPLLGKLNADGTIAEMQPAKTPPPIAPRPREQGELF